MTTQMPYAFEHGPSRTLVRQVGSGSEIRCIRDGKIVVRYHCHSNYQARRFSP